jgi:hypothetical protein
MLTLVLSSHQCLCIQILSSNYLFTYLFRSRVSSVSIVSDYGLDDRAVEVRSPARVKDFFSNLCVQTGSGAHPASCTMGTEGHFSGGKARPGRDFDHSLHPAPRPRSDAEYSPLSSAEVVNE